VLLAADTFAAVPRHVRALDVGAYRAEDDIVSLRGTGEFYLLSEWAEGRLYAESLRRITGASALQAGDLAEVDRLAEYLVALHGEKLSTPFARERALRDLFGSGEGIFGIVDGYPEGAGGVSRERLQGIERRCHEWRWKLKAIARPLVRTHGDFHPFNVLLDSSGEPLLLDTSRGSMGDPADDVTCMALNFPFFALERPGAWKDALSVLWRRFWERYLDLSGDTGLLDVAPPFLAWRGLVLASPLWYPKLSDEARARLLTFVETILDTERFSPTLAETMFR
jgi:aminoglycoside phosphotransferase (APT) family kinase protein